MENVISRNCQNLYLAVIAGGRGTRLFPHSHDGKPKQFCQLDAEHTFIQATVERFLDLGVRPTNSVIVTTNSNQGKLANDQLDRYGILSQNIIEIPFEYGYAGAMIEAAKFISRFDQNATIINTPSDHYIVANKIFSTVITQAIKNSLRTPTLVGVKTSNLATTMECGNAIYDPRGNSLCKTVTGFEEKPDETTADRLMREDRSAVNTGINIWTLKDIMEASAMLYNDYRGLSTDRLMNLFPRLNVAIGRFTWHDCGTLQALYEISISNKPVVERVVLDQEPCPGHCRSGKRSQYVGNCFLHSDIRRIELNLTVRNKLQREEEIRRLALEEIVKFFFR